MTILKTKGVPESVEADRAYWREKQKEKMVEVKKIREAIVELFDTNPDKACFSSKDIYEWLISKGITIKLIQVAPKMKMINNVFGEGMIMDEKGRNSIRTWHRLICDVCKRPMQLGEHYHVFKDGNVTIAGHEVCLQLIVEHYDIAKRHSEECSQLVAQEHHKVLELENDKIILGEEIERLRSMIPKPVEGSNGHRKIEL